MNRLSMYKWVVAVLVILNIGLTAFILLGKGKPPHKGPANKEQAIKQIQKQFSFDDTQLAAFHASMDRHFAQMQVLSPKLKEVSLAYYLSNGEVAEKDSLLQLADQYSDAIYLANNRHFEEVRSICASEQLPKMEEFITNLMNK